MKRPKMLVFDVNETLLDLAALKPVFASALGSTDAMGEWFARMLHGSLVANHTGRYRPFGDIGIEALLMVAGKRGIELEKDQARDVVGTMRRLPPHPDVIPGLSALRSACIRMITLTNGSSEAADDQMANSGLGEFFELSLSVDAVGRFKPAPETYLMASVRTEVEVDEMMMVAAHDWDVLGARTVGIPGAFVARSGSVWSLADHAAELVVPDITELAASMLGMSDVA